jgi:N-methylhydantoinase A
MNDNNSVRGSVVGVDVGGTYTDLFWVNASGATRTAKVPSTRPDQSKGIREGIEALGAALTDVATIVHGTTVGTNALLQRNGARTGIITTRGFRDVLEMRRRDRPQTWGLWGQFEPVVPRDLRVEVNERVLADGTVLEAVDADAVRKAALTLRERGAESLCIFFINSYANDANEKAALAAARQVWPNEHISVAATILPEIREFERASTAALNAYLQPVVGGYLQRLESGLKASGFDGELLIVQSNGGVMSAATARALPVRTALSGPAAGVIAAGRIAEASGFDDIITCDMGGTSFDVALIAGGQSTLTAQTAVDFGMVVRTPMIEITTIGAGGGSIAWVDKGGLLQIGPQSAGSDPGPACYGLGNDRPTVTDANLVLGRINAARPIGGRLKALDTEAAGQALDAHVGQPLGLDTVTAAQAVLRVANARMAGAIRLISIERGHDPTRFTAMPFGGAGALHVGALIKEVGLGRALVPRFPGVTSALGCVLADMRHDRVHTLNSALATLDITALDNEMLRTASEGRALLNAANVSFDTTETRFELDMLYVGQTHTVSVPLPLPDVSADTITTGVSAMVIESAFEAAYTATYGRLLAGIGMRVMNLRVAVIGKRPRFDLNQLAPKAGASVAEAMRGERQVHADGAWHTAVVYERLALPVGAQIPGPAILEQDDATVFMEPNSTATVDVLGNLIIEPA